MCPVELKSSGDSTVPVSLSAIPLLVLPLKSRVLGIFCLQQNNNWLIAPTTRSGEGVAVFYLQEKLNSVMSVCVIRKSIWKEEMYWDSLCGMTPGSQRASHVCTVFLISQFKSRVKCVVTLISFHLINRLFQVR